MSFDCGNCLTNSDQKVFDLIISTDDSFHLGKYCNFKCLQNDVNKVADQYEDKKVSWETMRNDIVDFFNGGSNSLYSYLLPATFISNQANIDVLNNLFHECNNPSFQKEVLCYWISCVEPGANWPNIHTFEEVKRPKVIANGAIIATDDGDSIVVADNDFVKGENFFIVKIKEQVHNISVKNISFNMFPSENVSI